MSLLFGTVKTALRMRSERSDSFCFCEISNRTCYRSFPPPPFSFKAAIYTFYERARDVEYIDASSHLNDTAMKNIAFPVTFYQGTRGCNYRKMRNCQYLRQAFWLAKVDDSINAKSKFIKLITSEKYAFYWFLLIFYDCVVILFRFIKQQ